MTALFAFEELTADFNRKLITDLRSHSASSEYLETWVPDTDPVKSMVALVEAALTSGCSDFRVTFAATTLDETQRQSLLRGLAEFGKFRIDHCSTGYALNADSAAEP